MKNSLKKVWSYLTICLLIAVVATVIITPFNDGHDDGWHSEVEVTPFDDGHDDGWHSDVETVGIRC